MARIQPMASGLHVCLTVTAAVMFTVPAAAVVAPDPRAATSTARPSAPTPRNQFPGFLLDRGRYTAFEAPEAGVGLFPGGINSRGTIVGEYLAPDRESGFRRDAHGRIIRIDLPGAAGTQIDKINDRGHIVGNYNTVSPSLPAEGSRGYLLTAGRLTHIDVPRARLTAPHGINNSDQVVGEYADSAGRLRGFLWTRGRYTTFGVPGAVSTQPTDINDHGQIVGSYTRADQTIHGFLLSGGRYTTIDAPGGPITFCLDINDRGQIAVSSLASTPDDPYAGARGFVLRDGARGPFTEVRFPGAPKTLVSGINNQGGVIGAYENPNAATATASGQRNPAAARLPLHTLPFAPAKIRMR